MIKNKNDRAHIIDPERKQNIIVGGPGHDADKSRTKITARPMLKAGLSFGNAQKRTKPHELKRI
jgi:hypothetical protein